MIFEQDEMLEIRNATLEDVPLLKQMYLNEVEKHEERAQTFADQLVKQYRTMLAIKDNNLCGTVSWDIRGGLDDGVVELISIGVNSAYQRQNVATSLVESMTREATQYYSEKGYNLRVIMLFMEKKNEVARKFYTSMKFEEAAVIVALYPQDDGSIWIRYLCSLS
ncbi:MAG: N-acetyltransferase family protein [Candidatus Thorarchaeota archaeon]|jgi:ribosomal protein S18 acetylase RimI-like enzyme